MTHLPNGCPFRGLADDPHTKLIYPSEGVVCRRTILPDEITLSHQQRYCLTEHHVACPLYEQQQLVAQRLSRRIVVQHKRRMLHMHWSTYVSLLVVFVVILTIWLQSRTPALSAEAVSPTTSQYLVAAISRSVTATPLPEATATPMVVATLRPIRLPEQLALVPTATPVAPSASLIPTPTVFSADAVTLGKVNIRSGPDISFSWLGTVGVAEQLTIMGRNAAGDWWQVCCVNDSEGWLSSTMAITDVAGESLPVVPVPTPGITVLAELVNVRSGPGLSYSIIGVAARDAQHTVVGQDLSGLWWQLCCFDDQVGWILAETAHFAGIAADVPAIPVLPPTPAPD